MGLEAATQTCFQQINLENHYNVWKPAHPWPAPCCNGRARRKRACFDIRKTLRACMRKHCASSLRAPQHSKMALCAPSSFMQGEVTVRGVFATPIFHELNASSVDLFVRGIRSRKCFGARGSEHWLQVLPRFCESRLVLAQLDACCGDPVHNCSFRAQARELQRLQPVLFLRVNDGASPRGRPIIAVSSSCKFPVAPGHKTDADMCALIGKACKCRCRTVNAGHLLYEYPWMWCSTGVYPLVHEAHELHEAVAALPMVFSVAQAHVWKHVISTIKQHTGRLSQQPSADSTEVHGAPYTSPHSQNLT